MPIDLSEYRNIVVTPVGGAIGAEVQGVDVGRPLTAVVKDELLRAFSQFHVLFIRDQQLGDATLMRFAMVFGEPSVSPLAGDEPKVSRMSRGAEAAGEMRNNGDRWHTDRAGDEIPPKGFLLYCEKAPEYGGDTMFAGLCAAYDALPPDMQEHCARLTGIHSMSGLFDLGGKGEHRWAPGGGKRPLPWGDPERLAHIRKEVEHPLVCRHPETGRPFLFVSGAYLLRIKGLETAESAWLVDHLNQHAVQPEFTCRFRWRRGSVAILDNRCTQHYAVNDYAGFERSMLRIELAGDWRPVATAPQLLYA